MKPSTTLQRGRTSSHIRKTSEIKPIDLEDTFKNVYEESAFAAELIAKSAVDTIIDVGAKKLYENYLNSKVVDHVTDSMFFVMNRILKSQFISPDQHFNDHSQLHEQDVLKSEYDTFSSYVINVEELPQQLRQEEEDIVQENLTLLNQSQIQRATFYSNRSKRIKSAGGAATSDDDELDSKQKKAELKRQLQEMLVPLPEQELTFEEAKELSEELKIRAYRAAQQKEKDKRRMNEEEKRLKDKRSSESRKKILKELESKPFTYDYDGQLIMLNKNRNSAQRPPVVVPLPYQIKTQIADKKLATIKEIKQVKVTNSTFTEVPQKPINLSATEPIRKISQGNQRPDSSLDNKGQNNTIDQCKSKDISQDQGTNKLMAGLVKKVINSNKLILKQDKSAGIGQDKTNETTKVSFALKKNEELYERKISSSSSNNNTNRLLDKSKSLAVEIKKNEKENNNLETIQEIASRLTNNNTGVVPYRKISNLRRSSKTSESRRASQSLTFEDKSINGLQDEIKEDQVSKEMNSNEPVVYQTSVIPYIKMSEGVKLTEFRNGEQVVKVAESQQMGMQHSNKMTKQAYLKLIEQGNKTVYNFRDSRLNQTHDLIQVNEEQNRKSSLENNKNNKFSTQHGILHNQQQNNKKVNTSAQLQEQSNKYESSVTFENDEGDEGDDDGLDRIIRPSVIRDRAQSKDNSRAISSQQSRSQSRSGNGNNQKNMIGKQNQNNPTDNENSINKQISSQNTSKRRSITYDADQLNKINNNNNTQNLSSKGKIALPILPIFTRQKHQILEQMFESQLNDHYNLGNNKQNEQSKAYQPSRGTSSGRQRINSSQGTSAEVLRKGDKMMTFGIDNKGLQQLLVPQ